MNKTMSFCSTLFPLDPKQISDNFLLTSWVVEGFWVVEGSDQ